MDDLLRDLRHSFTLVVREKAFSLTVLFTLAVCVGANATIFSVVHNVLLAPLPYEDSDRLVVLYNSYPGAGVARGSNGAVDYMQRRARVDAFEEVALYEWRGATIGEAGETERAAAMRVTPSFFPLLRTSARLGRTFTEEEGRAGNDQVVVLSHGFWQDRFGGRADAVGGELRVDGRPLAVVGVLPESFRVTTSDQPRIFTPLTFGPEETSLRNWHSNSYEMMARLAPGATIEQARAQNDALNAALASESGIPNVEQLLRDVRYETVILSAHEDLVRDIRPTLWLLWGGVAFVLLIGCVNIANIILARSQVRLRDVATRLALGAPRGRLAREILTHSLTLALLGGALGVVSGVAGIELLGALGMEQLPRSAEIGLDGPVLLFTLAITVVAGLIFGSIPLSQLLRQDLRGVLGAVSRGGTADRGTIWIRSGLVTAQVALAFLLLIGAGLMLASFRAALSVDPGFRAEGVWTGFVSLPDARYPYGEARTRFVDALVAEVRSTPGVRAASVTTQAPFGGGASSSIILPEGYVVPPGESILSPFQTRVAPGYFETMGIPLLEGRSFEEADGGEGRRVVILDRWLADRYYPDGDAVGRRMIANVVPGDATEEDVYTVVGVVGTVKQNDLTTAAGEHAGAYYFPYRQFPDAFLTVVARADASPDALTGMIRERLTRLDPELPLFGVETMTQRIDGSLSDRRTPMVLLIGFAGMALLLAVLGIYGVLAYVVAQQTRELGIRMAMGSTAREIFVLVVSRGVRVTALGLVIGVALAIVLTRLIRSLLFGVQPLDPLVLGGVALLLAAVAVAACAAPAWQATRIDPVRALVG